ncbi:MAG TPA: dTDP-glucose 4,6-dehydratase [Bacteroidota bacterium]|nr:dTDP-glucose 4,6-dehydratase [Bacteroidota bacterium]
MKSLLVTGGAGFIGSNFVRYYLDEHAGTRVVNFDKLTYAGNLENLREIEENPRYAFVRGDICDREALSAAMKNHDIDAVVHFAAESHVDRSIQGAAVFVATNVLGTQVVLDAARAQGVTRFLHVSTDEVYGSLGAAGTFTESTPLHPNSPYAASKASSDLLALAAAHTFGFPALVTRCSNNYGPYQFPEKLIPLMIANATDGKPLPVYGQGLNVRDWLYVRDHCTALDAVLERGKAGEIYNIGGNNEWRNIDIVRLLLKQLGKPESLITFVKDRPGHDLRYAIDATKIMNELSWKPSVTFEEGLAETVKWYRTHEEWWRRITSGAYREYYREMYENR